MRFQPLHRFLPLAALAFGTPAVAQTITPLLVEGDSVSGVGLVTTVSGFAINNLGDWLVEADTDAATTEDGVFVKNGVLLFREAQPMTLPAGATLGSFDDLSMNAAGNVSNNFFLDNTVGSTDDSGIYWNDVLVVQESMPSNATAFTPGTPYRGFFGTKINDANQILVMASVDDAAIASTTDRAMVVFDVDGVGSVIGETVFAKEGDVFAAVSPEAFTDFGTGPHEWAFNSSGDIMFSGDLTGATATNAAIFINTTLIAREGDPSPVLGRNWATLTDAEMDLSDNGNHHVYSASLDGDTTTNLLIVKDGAKFRQEGDSLAPISPFLLTSFGTGPVHISDSGDVLWYGDWDDPVTTQDKGLFVNDELLVQIGVTQISGSTVTTLRGITDGYAMSRDGRYVIFEAILANGDEGAFLIDRQSAVTLGCFGDGSGNLCPCGNLGATGEGCANSTTAGALAVATGTASVGAADLVLTVSQVAAGQPGLFFQGINMINGGLGNPFGDGLRCAGGAVLRIEIATSSGGGVAQTSVDVAAEGGVSAGDTRHYQYWYRDPIGSPCASSFNFSPLWTVIWEI